MMIYVLPGIIEVRFRVVFSGLICLHNFIAQEASFFPEIEQSFVKPISSFLSSNRLTKKDKFEECAYANHAKVSKVNFKTTYITFNPLCIPPNHNNHNKFILCELYINSVKFGKEHDSFSQRERKSVRLWRNLAFAD